MKVLLALLVVVLPALAAAQATPPPPAPLATPAKMDPQAPPAPPPPRREGTAEFAFVGTTGNSSTQTIGLSGEFTYRPQPWSLRTRAEFLRNESDDELTAETFGFLLRGERTLNARTALFGEYAYFRDEFSGVDHRNSLVGGVSYKVLDLPKHLFFVDAGLGYLNEQRLVGEDVSSGTYALGAGYRWKLSDSAELSEDLRFTGLFAASDDWRVYQGVALTTRINRLLSLKVSNVVRFVNDPVDGFEDTDTSTAVTLVAKF